jgi:hypothetical protein
MISLMSVCAESSVLGYKNLSCFYMTYCHNYSKVVEIDNGVPRNF